MRSGGHQPNEAHRHAAPAHLAARQGSHEIHPRVAGGIYFAPPLAKVSAMPKLRSLAVGR